MFRGTLRLAQPAKGHRAGTDAVLLAAAAPPEARVVLDLGASTGVVGLRVAMTHRQARVTLLENEPAMVALAEANVGANELAGRVSCRLADALALGGQPDLREAFDLVLTNPPYFAPGRGRPSPVAQKRRAHEMTGDLETWLRNAATVLAPGGRLVMIHRADALDEVLAACRRRFGSLRLKFIHPEAGAPAHRLLVAGRKGSRAGLAVLPPLVLAEAGVFTAEARALHEGTAHLLLGEAG